MGGVCVRYSGTCRPAGLLFLILAAVPCMLHTSESPAVVVGKMYPRGNHWAVGHLMGKKSVESQPDPRKEDRDDGDDLAPLGAAGVTGRLLEALLQREDRRRTMPRTRRDASAERRLEGRGQRRISQRDAEAASPGFETARR